MNKLLLALTITTGLIAADTPKNPVTPELHAKFWRAQFEQKIAADNLKDKNDAISAVVGEIKAVCKTDLELDSNGNIACKKVDPPKETTKK